jgi:lipid II:glycine glycyltransferase (peptidoglycan interpeptide bridge formation enzyme)
VTDLLEVSTEPPPDWDARVVDPPGGHVLQSRAWARHRARSGWHPLFLSAGAAGVLALTRPWPLIGGSSAYLPRGPVPTAGGEATARLLVAAAATLAEHGIDVVAADPEVPAADAPYRDVIAAAGFRPIEEIQPSRHRLTLPLGNGIVEAAAFGRLSKSSRQRVRTAEAALEVVRFDARHPADGVGDGFVRPTEAADPALDRFYDLLHGTGERRHFSFGSRAEFVGWWRAALVAGHLVYLEARTGDVADEPVAALVLYRHGGRLSTVHSADRAESRAAHPGALHLLRWRAIQLAIRDGCTEMDLGGADVAGARREPREGEPMFGLYRHKRSFGAEWLALAGAHERVIHPNRYRIGRIVARLARLAGGAGR